MQAYSEIVRHELSRLDSSELLQRFQSSDLTDEARNIALSILSERGVSVDSPTAKGFSVSPNPSEYFDEEAIYATALAEVKKGTVRPGLWAKAFAESEGDQRKSQALYMKLRVQEENEQRQPVRTVERPFTVSQAPSGVGGWLLLLVVGMIFVGPLLGAVRLNADLMMAEYQFPSLRLDPKWGIFNLAVWWSFLGVAVLSIYGGLGLARERHWSVVTRAKIVLWLSGPAGAIVLGVLIPRITLGSSDVGSPELFVNLFFSTAAAGIWTAYLSKSKRVRNTYSSSS